MLVKKQQVRIYPDERGYTIVEDKNKPANKLKELDMNDLKLWMEDEMKFSDAVDVEDAS